MTTRLLTTPLGSSATIVAYNESHTTMSVYDQDGSCLTVWHRDGPTRQWIQGQSWNTGPVKLTSLAWAPREFGSVVSAGAADGTITIWRLASDDQWLLVCKLRESSQSVLSLCFAPAKLGPLLTAAYADGNVKLFEASAVLAADAWALQSEFRPSNKACTSLSWRETDDSDLPPLLLIGTAGGSAQVWLYREELMTWERVLELGNQSVDYEGKPIADVAWAPTLGRENDLLAVAAGNRVVLWSLIGSLDASLAVERVATLQHNDAVWQLGWNLLGNWLAASTEGGEVCMWRPDLSGEWNMVNVITGAMDGMVA